MSYKCKEKSSIAMPVKLVSLFITNLQPALSPLDAVMSSKTEKCLEAANAMFAEVHRVLKANRRS
ncbi:hypothetical protein T08_4371 [Trichinella sp. T8]|nr:hypothetical protein T08_4371 [Trichinella sp. T8]